ncbi:hypothetical protein [Nonomuraea endophytica]|uniref:Uncharacterized protein n=1 Tax=Nonomuraea endophytica TaxID=714136 RepID=A0A7W8EDW6_9ACTN|nr:hypothetical protein [Nonomuraea endophytica]MBB5075731.1 hypothetical protein [Nonomuraea endophytica]
MRSDMDGLYAWYVGNGDSCASLGITDEFQRADAHMAEAIESLPGKSIVGVIRQAWLNSAALNSSYVYGRVLVQFRRDRETGVARGVADA